MRIFSFMWLPIFELLHAIEYIGTRSARPFRLRVYFFAPRCVVHQNHSHLFFGKHAEKTSIEPIFFTVRFVVVMHIPYLTCSTYAVGCALSHSKAQHTIYIDNTSEIGKLHIDWNWIGLRCVKWHTFFVHTMQLDTFHCVSATAAVAVDVLICRCKPLCRCLKNVHDSFLQSKLQLQSHSKDDN